MKRARVPRRVSLAKLNTHYYDGKMKDTIDSLRPHLDEASKVPPKEKLANLYDLKKMLTSKMSPTATKILGVIIQTYQSRVYQEIGIDLKNITTLPVTSRDANFSPEDDLHAEDLLWLCYKIFTKLKDDVE